MTNNTLAPEQINAAICFDVGLAHGLDVAETARRFRAYAYIERRSIKLLAGWFLRVPAYEMKYTLGYHLYDHAEHVSALRKRLEELRGGQPDASVPQGLRMLMEEALHAPDEASFLRGLYGVIKRALVEEYRAHLALCDKSANANEVRLLRRMIEDLEAQLAWYDALKLGAGDAGFTARITALLQAAGGVIGHPVLPGAATPPPAVARFERPKTLHFDARIQRKGLVSYETRGTLAPREAAIEQFKVFFNEAYAAAILAGMIFDAFEDSLPWEFFADFSRHFWDEVRHSEFGALRLKEFGHAPETCDPTFYEASESLPILHRLTYLTLGLEVYFMPRKGRRVKEYSATGDHRSQLFADHDWSDETNHVHYGKHWVNHLLEHDTRTVEDVQEEVKAHLERVLGQPVKEFSAPY